MLVSPRIGPSTNKPVQSRQVPRFGADETDKFDVSVFAGSLQEIMTNPKTKQLFERGFTPHKTGWLQRANRWLRAGMWYQKGNELFNFGVVLNDRNWRNRVLPALNSFERARKGFAKLYGEDDLNVGLCYLRMAYVHKVDSNNPKAKSCAEKADAILSKKLQAGHPLTEFAKMLPQTELLRPDALPDTPED